MALADRLSIVFVYKDDFISIMLWPTTIFFRKILLLFNFLTKKKYCWPMVKIQNFDKKHHLCGTQEFLKHKNNFFERYSSCFIANNWIYIILEEYSLKWNPISTLDPTAFIREIVYVSSKLTMQGYFPDTYLSASLCNCSVYPGSLRSYITVNWKK